MIKDDNSRITLSTTRQYSEYHLQNTAIKGGEILTSWMKINLSRWNLLHIFNWHAYSLALFHFGDDKIM